MKMRPIIIGIVGGIASGKSKVAGILTQCGAARISADELGHRLLRMDQAIQKKVIELFGESILDPSKQIDRKRIAERVFGNDAQSKDFLNQLEAILHPAIRQLAEEELAAYRLRPDVSMIVIDAPLLIEAKWDSMCDEIIFVDTPVERRQQWAAQRGWSTEELARREASQLPLTEKLAIATKILLNDGNVEQLRKRIMDIVYEIEHQS